MIDGIGMHRFNDTDIIGYTGYVAETYHLPMHPTVHIA